MEAIYRVVWSYWEGERSALIDECESSWRVHLGDAWDVRVLNARTIAEYGIELPAAFRSVLPALQADYVRLALLERYGGVWMDASVMLMAPLDDVVAHLGSHDVVAFQRRQGVAYIENWFLAVRPPPVPLITHWKDLFVEIIAHGPPYHSHPAYAARCQTQDDYFVAYQAYCALLRRHPALRTRVHVHGIGNLWLPFLPLRTYRPLVKFTKGARLAYPYARFPLGWILLLALCTVLVVATAACALPFRAR